MKHVVEAALQQGTWEWQTEPDSPLEPAQNPQSSVGASGSDDPCRLGLGVAAESVVCFVVFLFVFPVGDAFDYKPTLLGGNLDRWELIRSSSPDTSVKSVPAHSSLAASVNTSDYLTGLMRSISQRYLMSNSAWQIQQLTFVGVTTAFIWRSINF